MLPTCIIYIYLLVKYHIENIFKLWNKIYSIHLLYTIVVFVTINFNHVDKNFFEQTYL